MSLSIEFDFEFTKGEHHYYAGKKKENLPSSAPAARAGFEAAKFQHLKKVAKSETN